ncbi:Methyltransferase domain-containing protein [Tessaracoccus bendigoensis DSM 12906]|uniref:Methyltransferase domain-containing protein n=2 Tax=Tessaracoccus TaxID=72763 RepID=A0A1M6HJV9_9ACTN|nr:Methyltransferase domain-containing protein [Tessaracoccus bendigoensis DSM 12906]
MTRATIPSDAIEWLSAWRGVRALVLAEDAAWPRRLDRAGHHIFVMSDDPDLAAQLNPLPRINAFVARPEAIPTDPFQFEVVFVHQRLHRFDLSQALPQIARVLRPGGCLSASYLIRDDSVPWVRRLAALLRRFDPMAMKGNYGNDSLAALKESRYFPETEERAFRVWQSVSHEDLLNLVRRQPLAANLDETQLSALLRQVSELFDSAVRPGESLRLPFQLICCRAWVNHEGLTATVALPESALSIPL